MHAGEKQRKDVHAPIPSDKICNGGSRCEGYIRQNKQKDKQHYKNILKKIDKRTSVAPGWPVASGNGPASRGGRKGVGYDQESACACMMEKTRRKEGEGFGGE